MEASSNHNTKEEKRMLPSCPICHQPLSVRLTKGRKSKKPFLMLICPVDGRHFRGFIGDRGFINQSIDQVEVSKYST